MYMKIRMCSNNRTVYKSLFINNSDSMTHKMSHIMRKPTLCIYKKTQTSFMGTVKLIRAFVFAIGIVQFFFFLNLKFPASSCLQVVLARFVLDLVRNHNVGFLMTLLKCSILEYPEQSHSKLILRLKKSQNII